MTLDATNSCPLDVGMHCTLGGIGLNVTPSNILFVQLKGTENYHTRSFHFCFLTKM